MARIGIKELRGLRAGVKQNLAAQSRISDSI
jgi:hypothetical protein